MRPQLFRKDSYNNASYTLSEIAQHDSNKDLWMIIHGKVYDVTSIIDEHPGGAEVLFECAGLDASDPFDEVGHSQDSVMMLKPLFVGYVKEDKVDITNDNISDEDDYEAGLFSRHKKNMSLGESDYLKEYKKKRKSNKKIIFNDKYLTYLLIIMAIITGILYMYLIRKKLDE